MIHSILYAQRSVWRAFRMTQRMSHSLQITIKQTLWKINNTLSSAYFSSFSFSLQVFPSNYFRRVFRCSQWISLNAHFQVIWTHHRVGSYKINEKNARWEDEAAKLATTSPISNAFNIQRNATEKFCQCGGVAATHYVRRNSTRSYKWFAFYLIFTNQINGMVTDFVQFGGTDEGETGYSRTRWWHCTRILRRWNATTNLNEMRRPENEKWKKKLYRCLASPFSRFSSFLAWFNIFDGYGAPQHNCRTYFRMVNKFQRERKLLTLRRSLRTLAFSVCTRHPTTQPKILNTEKIWLENETII